MPPPSLALAAALALPTATPPQPPLVQLGTLPRAPKSPRRANPSTRPPSLGARPPTAAAVGWRWPVQAPRSTPVAALFFSTQSEKSIGASSFFWGNRRVG